MSYGLQDVQSFGYKLAAADENIKSAIHWLDIALDKYVSIMGDPDLYAFFPNAGTDWNVFVSKIDQHFKDFALNMPQLPPLVGG